MPSLEGYRGKVREIIKGNNWSKTPNVTLLEAAKKIIEATDRWRRCRPSREIAKNIMESVFFLLATCNNLEESVDLDKMLGEICREKRNHDFKEVPNDIIWSFIIYASEPHFPYRKPGKLETTP